MLVKAHCSPQSGQKPYLIIKLNAADHTLKSERTEFLLIENVILAEIVQKSVSFKLLLVISWTNSDSFLVTLPKLASYLEKGRYYINFLDLSYGPEIQSLGGLLLLPADSVSIEFISARFCFLSY